MHDSRTLSRLEKTQDSSEGLLGIHCADAIRSNRLFHLLLKLPGGRTEMPVGRPVRDTGPGDFKRLSPSLFFGDLLDLSQPVGEGVAILAAPLEDSLHV